MMVKLTDIEEKLLAIRRKRKQPSADDKILCGLNSLLAISLIQAGRFMGRKDLESDAALLVKNILNKFWDGKALKHSFYKGVFQEVNYLFDAAALLTAVSMLYENDISWGQTMYGLASYVESFNEVGKWKESSADDFQTVYASWSDHPVPSSVSLAEMGLARVNILSGKLVHSKEYREPFISDFYNISMMINNGLFHVIETSKPLSWSILPVNTIKVYGANETDCFMGTCRPLGEDYITK